jgi:hypothetical protein
MMLSCTAIDDVSDVAHSELEPNLILSIGKAKTMTRQGLDVIQDEGQEFRGLQSLTVIPFTTNGNAVTVDDTPQILGTTGSETERVTNKNYYYWDQCKMMRGTDRVLAWGKSNPVVGKESAVQNGQLTTTLNGRMYLKDITFSLKSIRETNEVDQKAKDLAEYMTTIANTDGWSTTDNEQLKTLYLNFIHAVSEGTGLMAGSAAHVKAYVTELRAQLEAIGGDLSNAIIGNIGDTEATTSCVNNGYPGTLGLPDGAAALRWTNGAFSVRKEATTLDNINSLTRYTYPAELWYFVDSPIRTSDQNVAKSTYQGRSWDDLITNNYKDGTRIGGNTQSVLVEQPLQYGVARLQMTLKRITASPLKDAKDAEVHYYQAVKLPLTAVIIGAQHTVGFDFKPMGEQSDLDARFIYDPIVGTPASNGDHTVNTLVLQTYDGEKVPVVLEFENLTDEKFTGKDGVVYPNTKFYLIGMLDATNEGSGVYWNRVFTQDHTTQVTFEVTSLANAYTCMPDLLSPRLELGVQVQTKWVQSSTTTVVLD